MAQVLASPPMSLDTFLQTYCPAYSVGSLATQWSLRSYVIRRQILRPENSSLGVPVQWTPSSPLPTGPDYSLSRLTPGQEIAAAEFRHWMTTMPPAYMSADMLQVGEGEPDESAYYHTFTATIFGEGEVYRYVGRCPLRSSAPVTNEEEYDDCPEPTDHTPGWSDAEDIAQEEADRQYTDEERRELHGWPK